MNYRFAHLEGFRAYLALWVVIGHAVQFTTLGKNLGLLSDLLNPGHAVQGFMILSGFVIAHLLLVKEEPYPAYILRRFMRLAPIFFVCLAAGWATYGWLVSGISALPWHADPAFVGNVAKWQHRAALMAEQPVAHTLVHLTMLHGAVPGQLLEDASGTILAPGWSISLEWQFYLVAPAILYLLQRRWGWSMVFAGVLAGLALTKSHLIGTLTPAFFGASSIYLVFGMVCRLALPALAEAQRSPWPTLVMVVTLVLLLAKSPLDLLPWAVLFPFIIDSARGGDTPVISRLFASRPVLAVGRVSYSIYLAHFVVQSCAVYLTVRMLPDVTQPVMLGILLVSVPLTVALSFLLYAGIERPGIALGHLLARRLRFDSAAPARPAVG